MKFKVRFLPVIVAILGIAIDNCECKMVGFAFGDSLSDVGNNNRLPRSLARPNLPWYGVDFGNGLPNGRFTNGRIILDIVGMSHVYLLYIQFIHCYSSVVLLHAN